VQLDLVGPYNAVAAAQEVRKHEARLDILSESVSCGALMHAYHVLVNNDTGIPTAKYELTPQGFESLLAIKYNPLIRNFSFLTYIIRNSHIGHFVLTTELLSLLQQTTSLPHSDVRVITVSSMARTTMKQADFSSKAAFQLIRGKPGDTNVDGLFTAMASVRIHEVLEYSFHKELQREFWLRLHRIEIQSFSLSLTLALR
jgi:hypothetical protein